MIERTAAILLDECDVLVGRDLLSVLFHHAVEMEPGAWSWRRPILSVGAAGSAPGSRAPLPHPRWATVRHSSNLGLLSGGYGEGQVIEAIV